MDYCFSSSPGGCCSHVGAQIAVKSRRDHFQGLGHALFLNAKLSFLLHWHIPQDARNSSDDGHLQVISDQAQQLRSRDKIIAELRSRQQAIIGEIHRGVNSSRLVPSTFGKLSTTPLLSNPSPES